MTVCVGVDAGQSSVELEIADERGRTLVAERTSGGSFVGDGRDLNGRIAEFAALARDALGVAGIDPESVRIAALVAGISGYDEEDDRPRALGGLACVRCVHDATVAHAGAFGGGDGIVVIAGSGSVAYGRVGSRRARVGGWGATFGDRGSAFWLGRRAISEAMAARDRDAASPLVDLVEAELRAGLRELQHAFAAGRVPPTRVAALAEAVLAAAAHDLTGAAGRLADEAIAALWDLATLTAVRIVATDNLAVASVGGLFANVWFSRRFRAAARFGLTAVAPLASPAGGALALARADAGFPPLPPAAVAQ